MLVVFRRRVEVLQRERRRWNIVHGPAIVLRANVGLQMHEEDANDGLVEVLVRCTVFVFERIDDVEEEEAFAFALQLVLRRVLLNVEVRVNVHDARLLADRRHGDLRDLGTLLPRKYLCTYIQITHEVTVATCAGNARAKVAPAGVLFRQWKIRAVAVDQLSKVSARGMTLCSSQVAVDLSKTGDKQNRATRSGVLRRNNASQGLVRSDCSHS